MRSFKILQSYICWCLFRVYPRVIVVWHGMTPTLLVWTNRQWVSFGVCLKLKLLVPVVFIIQKLIECVQNFIHISCKNVRDDAMRTMRWSICVCIWWINYWWDNNTTLVMHKQKVRHVTDEWFEVESLTCVLLTSCTILFVSWRNNNGDDDCATRWMEKPMCHYLGANKYQNVSYHLFDFEVVRCYLCSFTIYNIDITR